MIKPFSNRFILLITLVTLLASVYLFTYNASFFSGDTMRSFDATNSLVKYNDYLLDDSAWFIYPEAFTEADPYPLREYQVTERTNVLLMSIFYRLADVFPDLGYVHVVKLLNIIITITTTIVLYFFCLQLGYNDYPALLVALTFALCTLAWSYANSLFREPQVSLCLLLSFFSLTRVHLNSTLFPKLFYYFMAILWFLLAFSTKETAIFALPALLIAALNVDPLISHFRLHKLSFFLLMALIALPFLLFFNFDFFSNLLSTLPTFSNFEVKFAFYLEALPAYLWGINSSLWATSPILLLTIPAIFLLYKSRKHTLLWTVLTLTIAYIIGHALLTGEHWFGGLSLPPRFLVPVLPFLILLTAPLWQWLSAKKRSPFLFFFIILITFSSLALQLIHNSVAWVQYFNVLDSQIPNPGDWIHTFYQIEFARWLILPKLWPSLGIDFSWNYASLQWWAILLILLMLSAFLILILTLKNRLPGFFKYFAIFSFFLLPFLTYAGLTALYHNDPHFWPQTAALWDVTTYLKNKATQNDVLLLASAGQDNTYERFFWNYMDNQFPRIIGLPLSPGENISEKDLAPFDSANPADLMAGAGTRMLDHLTQNHERIFLLAHTGPYMPWSKRPVEKYLSQHFYPVQEIELAHPDPAVRLLEYYTLAAPDPFGFISPETPTDFLFGNHIQLLGYTLPRGTTYSPADYLPISFYWKTDQPLTEDYVMTFFVADSAGKVIVQSYDSQALANFLPTTSWPPNQPIQDNRALQLPPDLPPGEYLLWLIIYHYTDTGIQRLPITGNLVLPDNIAQLSKKIVIK